MNVDERIEEYARNPHEYGDCFEQRHEALKTIVRDALEEAGCEDAAILNHCRGPGPHVRGCWTVDLLLGKE